MSHLKITMTGPALGRVYVDGVEIPHVTGVSFSARAGGLAIANIQVFARRVEIESPATEVYISKPYAEGA
jgi:hypothetical protein